MADKELNEIYWTRETIKNRWSEQGIREDLDEETIIRKFRRILENKLKLSKEEIEWFKIARKGNQKTFVFNKEVDVPKLVDELFTIFEKENMKELVSVKNEKRVKTILTEILPNPYEETKCSRKEEIQKCLDFLDEMNEFSIFREAEFSVASEMIEEMQNFMQKVKTDVREGKNDYVRMKEYEIKEELIWKKSTLYKMVNECFIYENQKYYFNKILCEAAIDEHNIQEYWEKIYQWSDKWLKIIERIKCIREAEKFYNIFELFEVNKEFQVIKIDEKEKNECFEKLSLDSSDELKEYEKLFVKIGIGRICLDLIRDFEGENISGIVNNKIKSIKGCLNKMDKVYSAILENLTRSDRFSVKEMAFDELLKMGEEKDKNMPKEKDKNGTKQEEQDKKFVEVRTVENEPKSLKDVIKDIRNMDKVQLGRMTGKYTYWKRNEREKSELCKDLEYVYAIKQAEGETILKYLPYRNFINM